MTPEPQSPEPGARSSRLRILLPLALVTAGLALFLALFWHAGHGGKGHGRRTAAERNRSPVGGSGDESNTQVTGGGAGGSPVGGGPSRSSSGGKGETWWYHDGKTRGGSTEDAWWSPKKNESKAGSRRASPVGETSSGDTRADAGSSRDAQEEASETKSARERDKPAHASSSNPGEVAGRKGGPDDFWWRN